MASLRPARLLPALTVALMAIGSLTACSAAPDKGDCLEQDGDSYSVADCATAPLRVLERFDHVAGDCVPVAGVTESYSDSGSDTTLCIGPRDVDPEAAINVAEEGDCVAGLDTAGDGRRVACDDPAAESVILKRIDDATATALTIGGDECSPVPGVSATYRWSLESTGDGVGAISDGLTDDVLFCLGPVGVDPNTSVDLAQVGDCVAAVKDDPLYRKVDCGDPTALYRVVERVDDAPFIPAEAACRSADGATSSFRGGRGMDSYVLCLTQN